MFSFFRNHKDAIFSYGMMLALLLPMLMPSGAVYRIVVYAWVFPAIGWAIYHYKAWLKSQIGSVLPLLFVLLVAGACASITVHALQGAPIKSLKHVLLTVMWCLGWFIFARETVRMRALIHYFIVAAGISSALALLCALIFGTSEGEGFYRLEGFALTSHPIMGIAVYAMAGIFALYQLLGAPDMSSGNRKAYVTCFAVISIAVFFSFSKGLWLSYGLVVLLLLISVASSRVALALVFSVVALLGVLVLHIYMPIIPGLHEAFVEYRPFQILFEKGGSHRLDIWRQSLQLIAQQPWFGHGAKATFPLFSHPHNIWLSAGYYYGLIYSLIFTAFSLLLLARLWAGPTNIWRYALSFSLLVCFFDGANILDSPYSPFLMIIWFPAASALAMFAQNPGQEVR